MSSEPGTAAKAKMSDGRLPKAPTAASLKPRSEWICGRTGGTASTVSRSAAPASQSSVSGMRCRPTAKSQRLMSRAAKRERRRACDARGLFAQILEELAHLGEEAFALRMGAMAGAFLLELAQQFLLPLGEVDRRLDHHLDIHVAARGRAQHRHALAPQPELVAALRARRHVDLGAPAIDGRHLDRAAERRRRHGD